ncbi:regulator of G-protein signaling [Acrasis kona]|uniref:Regulator of G-protein signaling n=1 Tax=Acrasis kona TaxID=1008807 RepID=A0AAW2YNA6_9EUKA
MGSWGCEQTLELISFYDISLDKVLDGESSESFEAFLTKTHNTEPFLFLKAVKKFVDIQDVDSRYNAAKDIMKEFVEPNSPKEINVSSTTRQHAMDLMQQSNSTTCALNLFEELRIPVYMELKDDTFPNFLSSDIFVEHIEEMLRTNTEYLSQIGVMRVNSPNSPTSPTRRKNTLFSKQSLQINDEDFDAMCQDIKADDLLKSMLSVSISQSRNRHFTRYKNTFSVELDREEVFNVLSSQSTRLDEALKSKSKVESTFTCNGYYVATTHDIYYCPFPMTHRDYSSVTSCRRQSCGSIIIIKKSVVNPEVPSCKKYVRAHHVQGILIENKNDGSQITILSFIDLSGPSLFKKLVKKEKRDARLCQAVLEEHNEQIKTGKKGSKKGCFLYESLMYFESNKNTL